MYCADISGAVCAVYPVAWLHVTIELLKDVGDQLFDLMLEVEDQTNHFKVPVNDIFLPTEGDFARLRLLVRTYSWMFPEAFEWPKRLREEMSILPVSLLGSFTGDFEREANKFTKRLTEVQLLEQVLEDWITRVEATQEDRDQRDAPV